MTYDDMLITDIKESSSGNFILQCDVDSPNDCTGIYGDTQIVSCNDGEHCQIDCSGNEACKSHFFDASNALSVTLNCLNKHTCEYFTIRCPVANNASCIIRCRSDDSCKYGAVIIDAEDAYYNKVFIDCYWKNSCERIKISIEVAEIDEFYIYCGANAAVWEPCSYMDLSLEAHRARNVTAICFGPESCLESSWLVTVADLEWASFDCVNRESCKDALFDFTESSLFELHCSGQVCFLVVSRDLLSKL